MAQACDLIDRSDIDQKANQIVDISGWPIYGDYEVFPEGARDKSLRISPNPSPYSFCLSGHRYLFKEAIKSARNPGQPRHPDQYWAELIAFRIGRLMGLTLPPVFIAIDSSREEPGTISEWFMDYPQSKDERYSAGGDFMQRHISEYDRQKGRQHNLSKILALGRRLAQRNQLTHDWQSYWGFCLCFDALIGNTDRHQENWGVIWSSDDSRARFTPYFDNGTSLGHELQSKKMQNMMHNPHEFDAYLTRGKHQMRWSKNAPNRLPLIEGVASYCSRYPKVKPALIESLSGWKEEALETILQSFTRFDIPQPFTQQRAEFVAYLTLKRRERLLRALEN
ncbi:hypothetical protein SAMN05421848_3063 [Kushneria avicenniae]|uniref:HipA-like C-terminal domain-containing protein n=1 Tax=Kushneria avicenniae TaxID=402385 RepID=A0A1I1MNC7_9GAMM|nr:HipA domain-containing protein [Kushneria avicenniae]SFC86645.1 hypothetical protein SAMN05421848_3063 [Kushneria avicenniae]